MLDAGQRKMDFFAVVAIAYYAQLGVLSRIQLPASRI
jgi:hypothetical protein